MKKEKDKKKKSKKETQRKKKARELSKKSSQSSKTEKTLELKTGGKSTVMKASTQASSRTEMSFLRRSRTGSECKWTKQCSCNLMLCSNRH